MPMLCPRGVALQRAEDKKREQHSSGTGERHKRRKRRKRRGRTERRRLFAGRKQAAGQPIAAAVDLEQGPSYDGKRALLAASLVSNN